jgi:membrane protease YdiL (CAAX protease family)
LSQITFEEKQIKEYAFVVVFIALGIFGLALVDPSLVGFYLAFIFIPVIVSGGEIGYGKSISTILEEEDESTETFADATLWGLAVVVIGLMAAYASTRVVPFNTQQYTTYEDVIEKANLREFFGYFSNLAKFCFDVGIAFFVGFAEELAFRGPLLRYFISGLESMVNERHIAAYGGIAGMSLLFSAYHMLRYGKPWSNTYPFLVLFILGMLWGMLSYYKGLLSASMSHSFWDMFAVFAGGMLFK